MERCQMSCQQQQLRRNNILVPMYHTVDKIFLSCLPVHLTDLTRMLRLDCGCLSTRALPEWLGGLAGCDSEWVNYRDGQGVEVYESSVDFWSAPLVIDTCEISVGWFSHSCCCSVTVTEFPMAGKHEMPSREKAVTGPGENIPSLKPAASNGLV